MMQGRAVGSEVAELGCEEVEFFETEGVGCCLGEVWDLEGEIVTVAEGSEDNPSGLRKGERGWRVREGGE